MSGDPGSPFPFVRNRWPKSRKIARTANSGPVPRCLTFDISKARSGVVRKLFIGATMGAHSRHPPQFIMIFSSAACWSAVAERMQAINFTVDSRLLAELGERLVGKPHIALAELDKNSYDADATQVVIGFRQDRIEITDNGHGMNFDSFRDFWMRIGTTHK